MASMVFHYEETGGKKKKDERTNGDQWSKVLGSREVVSLRKDIFS